MADVLITSAAEGVYAEALSWYVERSVQAAERLEVEFDLAIQAIAFDPGRFPRCDEQHHYYLMRHFPYQGIYRQLDRGIAVIAVAHTSRKPRYWAKR